MPKFVHRSSSSSVKREELLAEAGVSPVRRGILIELAEAGVFETADRLTRSALADQFGLDLESLDQVVNGLERIAEDSYRARPRDAVDAEMQSADLELAEQGLSSYVTRFRAAKPDPETTSP